MKKFTSMMMFIAVIGFAPLGVGADRPPGDALPLSEIVAKLEREGYGPFSELEFDDGRWEIEAWHNDRKRELRVDPHSGEILSDRSD